MNIENLKVARLIFLIGILLFIILQLKLKLHSIEGTRHQWRNIYSLAVGLFFLCLTAFIFHLSAVVIFKSVFLGTLLFFPAMLWTRYNYKKKISGATLIINKKQFRLRYLYAFIVMAVVITTVRTNVGQAIVNAGWPFLGLLLSWIFTSFYSYLFISKIEKRLGCPILEGQEA